MFYLLEDGLRRSPVKSEMTSDGRVVCEKVKALMDHSVDLGISHSITEQMLVS